MTKKFKPQVDDIVVFNDLHDAALFRVKRIEGRQVVVVDKSIEHLNPHEQFVDLSLCAQPTKVQLSNEIH